MSTTKSVGDCRAGIIPKNFPRTSKVSHVRQPADHVSSTSIRDLVGRAVERLHGRAENLQEMHEPFATMAKDSRTGDSTTLLRMPGTIVIRAEIVVAIVEGLRRDQLR